MGWRGIMTLSQSAPTSRSGIRVRRGTKAVVGRAVELGAVEEAVEAARDGISGVSFEGEPGIGKSRLLLAAADLAVAHEFITASVSADEEIRGPFMLARGLLSAESFRVGASDRVVTALDRAYDLLSGMDDPGFTTLNADDRLLRVIDQATSGIRAAAQDRPLALLLPEDLQWADQDSVRSSRYVIRTQPALPVFFAIASRPEEAANAPELLTLLADLDRMGIVRRIRVGRFRQGDTAELLRLTLDGPVAPSTVTAIQAQAEGVPFVIEELARTYREAGCSSSSTGRGPSRQRPAASCPRASGRSSSDERRTCAKTQGGPGRRGDPRTQLPGGRRLRDPRAAGPDRLYDGRDRGSPQTRG